MIRHFEFFAVQQHAVYHKTRTQRRSTYLADMSAMLPIDQTVRKISQKLHFAKNCLLDKKITDRLHSLPEVTCSRCPIG
jgi:hypothetical protein